MSNGVERHPGIAATGLCGESSLEPTQIRALAWSDVFLYRSLLTVAGRHSTLKREGTDRVKLQGEVSTSKFRYPKRLFGGVSAEFGTEFIGLLWRKDEQLEGVEFICRR